MGKQINTEIFIQRAKGIHGDKYDYSKVVYNGYDNKVCIICPKHGEFWQEPSSHIGKQHCGCPSCAGLNKMNKDDFIRRAIEVHGDKYDYSDTDFISTHKKVSIYCPIHGHFEQTPKNHLKGQGCPECGKKYAQEFRKNNYKGFIDESKKRFGDIYDFPNIETLYINSHSKINITCKKCGNTFTKIACDHLTSPNGGCLHCYANVSKGEEEISEYIRKILPNERIILRDRNTLKHNELDIYLPERKVAFEYNGVYWHSNEYKTKNYHLSKLEECKQNGIALVQIFEDEYMLHKDIVLHKIEHILKVSNCSKIMGRKCTIKEIDYTKASDFLNKNHIQGECRSTVYLGAFYNNAIIGVMSFKRVKEEWELTRFATDNNYICQGVGGKLFKYFVNKFNPSIVKSFADRRWTINEDENIYTKLGFTKEYYTLPDYRYVEGIERKHKFGYRKTILHKKYGFPLSMSESEMINKLGLHKIYDCGLIKYVFTPN